MNIQLNYEYMNFVLEKNNTRRITIFNSKGMDIFEEFLMYLSIIN
jgi:hypothetical protein